MHDTMSKDANFEVAHKSLNSNIKLLTCYRLIRIFLKLQDNP